MTNDLAAAMERWTKKKYINSERDLYDCVTESRDAKLLAAAYARELDTSPITAELLVEDGWRQYSGCKIFHRDDCEYTLGLGNDTWWFSGDAVATIGQVRTLLRVFG